MNRSDKCRAIGNDHTAAGSGKLARAARKLRWVPVCKANKELNVYPLDEAVVAPRGALLAAISDVS